MHLFPVEDPEVNALIERETQRLQDTIDLIAAENHPPPGILAAQGSPFAIKAAEGYPGRRYHAGCAYVDALEQLAVDRCRALFGAEHANVQPHSGVAANLAVYFATLEVGDRVLSMELSHGGHLSHGAPVSMTSRCFDFAHYRVTAVSGCIDYAALASKAAQWRPKMIVAGASSYPRLIDYQQMAEIAAHNNAFLMVDMAHIAGLVAASVIPSPVPHADFVTFTTYKTLRGGRGGVILCKQPYAERIDRSVFPGCQGTPSMNAIAAKAVCFQQAATAEFKDLQRQTLANARCMAEVFSERGYRVISGGTDTHLLLLDLGTKGLTGEWAEKELEKAGLIVNRNPIPGARTRAGNNAGLRLGTPAISSRGMRESEARRIADWVDAILTNPHQERLRTTIRAEVTALCRRFPILC